MKELNDRWIDDHNNSWSIFSETEESAKKKSDSLKDCSNCSDCFGCFRCSYCFNCSDCFGCFNCSDCSNCSNCSDCSRCSYCSDCSNCSRCSDCSDCSNCSDCSRCSYCSNCSDCSRCSCCSDCSDCSDFKENPQRYYTSKIGSRDSQTKVYWIDTNVQIICGCWKGNLDEFEKRVKSTYPNGIYHDQYMAEIKKIRALIT